MHTAKQDHERAAVHAAKQDHERAAAHTAKQDHERAATHTAKQDHERAAVHTAKQDHERAAVHTAKHYHERAAGHTAKQDHERAAAHTASRITSDPSRTPSDTSSLRRTGSRATSEPPSKMPSDKRDPTREQSGMSNVKLKPDTEYRTEPLRLFIVNNIDEDLTFCEYLCVNTHFVARNRWEIVRRLYIWAPVIPRVLSLP